jgi:hypothetical protein
MIHTIKKDGDSALPITKEDCIRGCREILQRLVDDERLPKRETIAALTELKAEITKRIVAIRHRHNKPFVFRQKIQKYADRDDKGENPKEFLLRVYGAYLSRGLKPVQIRYEDPGFYNVLHTWCSRNKIDIRDLFFGRVANERNDIASEGGAAGKHRALSGPIT